ncbi:hypothetical protein RHSIM_Rhsim09G0186300 [Rhododendron simsii]|uniref:Zinc-ribbon domain-containing protein n=1 Tax=Rhododendron simsii TaxID=118357 RepID=A0A834GFK3_RHOSS|nr:hypothetical protein RHSIM_Rhsim09G0186300 [Rhododendron simsii]
MRDKEISTGIVSDQHKGARLVGSLLIFCKDGIHGCNLNYVGLSPLIVWLQPYYHNNMTGPLSTKLRLVRCPKCLQVLQESPNVPVYMCGGCNTVLQAKKVKNDTKDTDLHIPDPNMAKKDELEQDSEDKSAQSLSKEDKEAPTLSKVGTSSSSGELALDKNNGNDDKETEDNNMNQSGLSPHRNEESSPDTGVDQDNTIQYNGGDPNVPVQSNGEQIGGVNILDEVASPKEPNHHKGAESEVDKSRNCLDEENGGVNFTDEVASSTELNHLVCEESSSIAGAHSEVDENKNYLEEDEGRNQNEYGICNGKQTGGVNIYNEVVSSTELNDNEIEVSSPVVRAQAHREPNEHGICNGKQTGGVNMSDEVVSSTELNDNEVEAPIVTAHSEANGHKTCMEQTRGRNQSEFADFKLDCSKNTKSSGEISSSTELTCQEIEESTPVIATNAQLDENSKSPMSVDPSQKRKPTGFDNVSSVDTMEKIAIADYSSEFSVTHRDMPNFPTTSNYVYEGSVSSSDGSEDQVPDPYLRLFKRKEKKAKSPLVKAMHKRDEVMSKITSYPEMEREAWNCSSIPFEKKHYTSKGKWHQNELMEPMRHGPLVRSKMGFESGGYPPRAPFYSRGSQVSYEKGGPSNYRREELQYRTSLHSPNKPEKNHEEEKMELLKRVIELQDQLNRTRNSQGVGPEVDMCPRSCHQGRRWPHQNRNSRIPFSAEAKMSRYQVDKSCFHCCPHDRMSSAPLRPHLFSNKSQYKAHQSPRYSSLYSSTLPSPQYHTSSEFSLQSYDPNSDDHELKKYYRERNCLKRHVRPVAGGAPFVICYCCSELLQLPLDFLMPKRRFHKLMCSACSNTLKFSLEDRTRLFPYADDYTRDAVAPPPSEVDDYGPSLGKSCSTEGEPFSAGLPFQALKRDSYGRKLSSGSSFEPMGDRTRVPVSKEFVNKNKNPVEMLAAAGPSKEMDKAGKASSEIEELRPLSTSPLHKLMGYTSPSQVMDR